MNRRALVIATALLSLLAVSAPPAPAAAPQEEAPLVIRGGRVHARVGDEPAIEGGVVVVRAGLIAAVGGPDTPVPPGAQVIDATDLDVFPGMFDAVTRVGLTEIGAVDVTSDFRELGDSNPHLLAATAVHPASEIVPVTRATGLTHVVAAPSGNGISGQGSLIHLAGWTVEEMLIAPSVYMAVQWPSLQTRGFNRATFTPFNRSFREAKQEYDGSIADLEELLADARRYAAAGVGDDPLRRDLKLEALARVTAGELPLLISADEARAIRDAVAFAERNDVRIIIAGGAEAVEVAEVLVKADVPVILGPTQAMPSAPDDPYDSAYARPGKLHAAGVRFAISTFNASSARTLPFEAAMAVGYGLPWEEAFRAVTLYPAQILGVDDRLGTIEQGKIANLFVSAGDPLDLATGIEHLVIDGRLVDPRDNKHDRLYERYGSRPARQQR